MFLYNWYCRYVGSNEYIRSGCGRPARRNGIGICYCRKRYEGRQNSVSAGNMELEDPEYRSGVSDGNAELSDRESVILSLQVPSNLDFMIDPWNLSGRGQVYSERFTIKNSGNVPYTLWLRDMTCTAGGGAIPVGSVGEIYNEAVNVYLELAFEKGDSRVLSTESQDYEVILRPGEELAFRITGAVNEKTTEDWGKAGENLNETQSQYTAVMDFAHIGQPRHWRTRFRNSRLFFQNARRIFIVCQFFFWYDDKNVFRFTWETAESIGEIS